MQIKRNSKNIELYEVEKEGYNGDYKLDETESFVDKQK